MPVNYYYIYIYVNLNKILNYEKMYAKYLADSIHFKNCLEN